MPAYSELTRRLGFEYNGMVLHEYYEPGKAASLGARQSLLKPFIEDDLLYALQEVGLNG
jgi:hypothetical protein